MLRMTKMALSVLNLMLAAKYFGVSLDRDIWILALNCIVVLDAALWGPINETFRAKFISLKAERGERDSLMASGSLFVSTTLISVFIVIFIVLNREYVASIIAPGFPDQDKQALAMMLLVLTPSLLFNQTTQLAIGILNAYESFYIPEISSCVATTLNVVMIIIFAPSMGIYALTLGYYIGLVLLTILLLAQFRKRKIALLTDVREFSLRQTKPFILFALPFFVPYFFAQLNHVIEKSLASSLGIGVVSSLDYARKIPDVFLTVLTSVLTTMLVPVLSRSFAQVKVNEAFIDFKKMLQFGMLLVTLLTCFVSTSANEMIKVLYDQGHIAEDALARISELSTYYSWASLSIFLYLLFGLTLLSQNKGKVYAFIGLFAQLAMIIINIVLYTKLGPSVFPIGLCLSHAIAAMLLFRSLPFSKRETLLILLSYFGILLLMWSGSMLFDRYVIVDHAFLQLLTNGCFILLWLCLLLFVFRTEEYKVISTYALKIYTTLERKLMR
ncbi:lipid II flippase MurJ [Parapedobacter sp. DT-150]|uniref:lipid II flippase MurJ n=1 Tax=Parapedobacter sp. DT-150 TaxID=3396162 RepID=UPI003F1A522A